MSDHTPEKHPAASTRDPRARPGRRRLATLLAFGSLALLSLKSQAQGLGGWGWGRRRHDDGPDLERRLDYGIGYLVRELDGSAEQKDRLLAIARTAAADAKPLREQLRQARRKGLELLAAPTIDKSALEDLRARQLQAMDALSKRLLQSMTDSAEVLTPPQRQKLAQRMQQRMERR